jgi:hypothetical protein
MVKTTPMMIVDDDDSSFILEIRKYLFSIKTYLSLRLRGSWLIVTHDARIRGVVGIRIIFNPYTLEQQQ